jgi:hypothetical protein
MGYKNEHQTADRLPKRKTKLKEKENKTQNSSLFAMKG